MNSVRHPIQTSTVVTTVHQYTHTHWYNLTWHCLSIHSPALRLHPVNTPRGKTLHRESPKGQNTTQRIAPANMTSEQIAEGECFSSETFRNVLQWSNKTYTAEPHFTSQSHRSYYSQFRSPWDSQIVFQYLINYRKLVPPIQSPC